MLQPNVLAPAQSRPENGQQYVQSAEGQVPTGPGLPSAFAPQTLRPGSNFATQGGSYSVGNQPCTIHSKSCRSWLTYVAVMGYADWNASTQNQFSDMSSFPSIFNAPDINDEYNVLNEFLSSSLLDDGNQFPSDSTQGINPQLPLNDVFTGNTNGDPSSSMPPPKQDDSKQSNQLSAPDASTIARPKSTRPERDEEKFYMTIADPSGNDTGNDTPQERMNKLLEAKYNAGMLKPFNYVQGYARLGKYMESHLQPASRQRILRQLDKFRPKFRERMQKLTDMQLMLVEMWFERTLMEYDRVFASMAVPACAWRRTGEIFRGNKEMAELIHVPIDKLRDVSDTGWNCF